jgi:hypothetical protein
MTKICKDCGEKFLSLNGDNDHRKRHLQTHIDKWSSNSKKDEKGIHGNMILPDGLNKELYKVIERYQLGDKRVLCLWIEGQLNSAMRPPSRQSELQDRLKEWLEE